jgi:hypothetical protein
MKKGILVLLTLAMLAGIAMFCPSASAAETMWMCYGRVSYNGSPVACPGVKLYTDGWCYMGTYMGDQTGFFGIARLYTTAGYYHLCIKKDGNKWQHVRFYYDGSQPTDVGTVNLVNSIHNDPDCSD